ncbi:uncharacterized protein LOC108987275 [Juglans regia]|uniref:Uncharacterized protein LOC108987275 n=1 Tax=Juglans regia TaxID=51240 RepID=A0A6P9EFK4_JUGRE|nr:uncharacterized protein LOC108987275 [Juglans regia]
MALNHVSRLCRNVKESIDFYTKVLGFALIEPPQAFDFNGAWLFDYGVGIHLLQSKDHDQDRFSLAVYVKRSVEDEENGMAIDQLLMFNDPYGFMIEIRKFENLKLVPAAGSLGKIKRFLLIGTIRLSKWKASINKIID